MRQRITIENPDVPSHILGDPVYEKTSIFQLRFPFAEIRGRLRSEGLLAYMRKGVCITRKYVKPNNPNTPIQLNRQQTFGSAQHHWRNLSEEVRLAWKAYALKNIPQKPTAVAALAGFNAWVQTQTYRLGMGGEFGVNPPDHGLPPALRCLTQEAAPDETSYAFRVEHPIKDEHLEGKRLLVEITPAMPSLRRKPRFVELAWATDDTRCYMELQPSGSVYLLAGARFSVADGQRYGVQMRLVTTDGVPGPVMFTNFIKTISAEEWKELLPEPESAREPEPEITPAEVLELLFSGLSDCDGLPDTPKEALSTVSFGFERKEQGKIAVQCCCATPPIGKSGEQERSFVSSSHPPWGIASP